MFFDVYYIPGTLLGSLNTIVNRTNIKTLALVELTFEG